MPSTPQVVPVVVLFDYLLDDTAKALANQRVAVTLASTSPATSITPQTVLATTQQATTTDGNGYWQFSLVPNTNISPANTTYTVSTPIGSYDVTLGSVGPYQSTAVGTIVNVSIPLAPATSNLTGPLTVAGLLTAQAGLAVTGNATVSGNLVVSGTFSPASLTVTPGEPGIDTTTAGALLIGDNTATSIELGAATTISAGGLTVATGGLTVTGNSTVTGTLVVTAGLTVNAGGAAVTGNSTVTGTLIVSALLTASAALTVTTGDLKVPAGRLVVGADTGSGVAGDVVANRGGVSPGTGAVFFGSSAGAHNLYYNGTGFVFTDGLGVAGDPGAGAVTTLTLSNAVGIGNGVATNMQSPVKGTGTGPTSAVLVTDWIKIYDGATTKWVPAFT